MPIDRGALDQQLQSLDEGSKWWDQRELRDLPSVLQPDEQILAVSRGKVARVRILRRSWLIVVTNRRLLCMRSSGEPAWRQLEVPATQIARVSLRVGLFRGRVVVGAGTRTYRLLVPRNDAYKLLSALSMLAAPRNTGVTGFGPVLMVRRVMDHVLALPAAALSPGEQITPARPAPDHSELEQRIQTLEDDVSELRRQVAFLEQLLADRQAGVIGSGHAGGIGSGPASG
jgi:hypothetical protein